MDDVWMPELCDVEQLKQSSDPETAEYYGGFGWENLEVPSDCVVVAARMAWLKTRFDSRYAFRMLSAETMERWQVRLQNRFDETVCRYERAYLLYLANRTAMNRAVGGSRTEMTSSSASAGSDTVTSTGVGKTADTPDTSIVPGKDYYNALTKNDSTDTTSYGRTDPDTVLTETLVTGADAVRGVNESIEEWNDLDTSFVGEFENLFLNVFDY